jgi:hypothetical protein
MFRGNMTEAMGESKPFISESPHKEFYTCSCGAKRFKWESTNGQITVGGFNADEYVYACLGCGRKHTEKDIKAFFR